MKMLRAARTAYQALCELFPPNLVTQQAEPLCGNPNNVPPKMDSEADAANSCATAA